MRGFLKESLRSAQDRKPTAIAGSLLQFTVIIAVASFLDSVCGPAFCFTDSWNLFASPFPALAFWAASFAVSFFAMWALLMVWMWAPILVFFAISERTEPYLGGGSTFVGLAASVFMGWFLYRVIAWIDDHRIRCLPPPDHAPDRDDVVSPEQ